MSWRDRYTAPREVLDEIVAEARRTMPEESSDAVLCAELHRVADELRRRGFPVQATITLPPEMFDARVAELGRDLVSDLPKCPTCATTLDSTGFCVICRKEAVL